MTSVQGNGSVPTGGEPLVNLPALTAALRRRWRLVAVTAIIGLAAAIAISVASPPPFTATATALLHHSNTSDPVREMQTDTQLLKSRTVAQGAVDRLGHGLTVRELLPMYRGVALSDALLQVVADGPTAREAVRRTDALMTSFLSFRRQEFDRQAQVTTDRLTQRQQDGTKQLPSVNTQISAIPPKTTDADTARRLGELLQQRGVLNDQITSLGNQIDSTTLDAAEVVADSGVIDRPIANPRPVLKGLASNVAAGTVAGLALGTGWVIFLEVATDRVRRRRDIMMALGAPVTVSVGKLRGATRRHRRRFNSQLSTPNADVLRLVRQLRLYVASGSAAGRRRALVVVSVDSDGAAALAVAATAVDLSKDKTSVLVVDLTEASALAGFFGVRPGKPHTLWVGTSESTVMIACTTADASDPQLDDLRQAADVVLVLTALDPAIGGWHLREWGTTAVAVVTAGRSTSTTLDSVSLMLRNAGLDLVAAVLVGADRTDQSVGAGRVPQSGRPTYALTK